MVYLRDRSGSFTGAKKPSGLLDYQDLRARVILSGLQELGFGGLGVGFGFGVWALQDPGCTSMMQILLILVRDVKSGLSTCTKIFCIQLRPPNPMPPQSKQETSMRLQPQYALEELCAVEQQDTAG